MLPLLLIGGLAVVLVASSSKGLSDDQKMAEAMTALGDWANKHGSDPGKPTGTSVTGVLARTRRS